VGGGDPGLGDERIADRQKRPIDQFFDDCAAALKQRNAPQIAKIVLDDGVFDAEFRHPDWPAAQADRWFQPPVGGLNLNDNCADITVTVRGREIQFTSQPELPDEFFDSRLAFGKGKQHITLKRPAGLDGFQLAGTVRGGGTLEPCAVNDPSVFFAAAVRQALIARGVRVTGDVVRRALRPADQESATLLVRHTTPLPDVLWRANTFSQNLFAECLVKSLPAYDPAGRRTGVAGSWAAGTALVAQTLGQLGVDLSAARLRDGSGLSHENAVTPAQLVQLLTRMQRHPHARVFLDSLAQPGEPGSMQKRYDDALFKGHVRAKTGTLANVHALAGYATRPGGQRLIFAVLVDGPAGSELPYQVCKALVSR
jgi:serine-type D-Ala-D-Ala carboxypeptidase/endopeptidase (penicillin-binding protein 4)